MWPALAKTLDYLATAKHSQALDLLIAVLDDEDEAVRIKAANVLKSKTSIRAKVELLKRWDALPRSVFSDVVEKNYDFDKALAQILNHEELLLQRSAMGFIRLVRNFSLFGTILEMIESPERELVQVAESTIRELVDVLYDLMFGATSQPLNSPSTQVPSEQSSQQKNPHLLANKNQIYNDVLNKLNQRLDLYYELKRPRVILESILILGTSKHFAVRHLLWQAGNEPKEFAAEILVQHQHPGVMQLLVDQLSQKHPHPKALTALRERSDPAFILYLLANLPKRFGAHLKKNLANVTSIPWLEYHNHQLALIPASSQLPLIQFLLAVGIPQQVKGFAQQWLLKHGSAEARKSASEHMSRLDTSDLQLVVQDSLESEDEQVRAWATRQLRSSHVPDAIRLLVDRLDSDEPAVRQAARDELQGFNMQQVLAISENHDEQTAQRAAQLMLKINPEAIHDLMKELAHPIRRYRIRAANGARKMQLQHLVEPALLTMLEDSDTIVVRTAIETLGTIPSKRSAAAVQEFLDDPRPRISEAARAAVKNISHLITSQSEPVPN